ncbi:glucosaminidase domain-containing protein [Ferrimonas lipolytica]|uniref:Glucosaminidase n=1 Tax=Ferrimonas lipolytica TaxID=2724191 RepID=A0A6H1UC03_9GAMM|nr:glucosaminidase domain-containing protein [Ferrimonas lipolytica]QIZ76591.1 glucosaminidase [Ferrimonas lipolytica]
MKSGRIKKVTLGLAAVGFGLIIIASQFPSQKLSIDTLPLTKNERSSDAPDFASINDIAAKKVTFFDYLRPKVEQQNRVVAREREFLLSIKQSVKDQRALTELEREQLTTIAHNYRFEARKLDEESIKGLLERVDVLPTEMVLVQAANESGWGSSRFAVEGNNYFGQWCFSKGCGLVPNARSSGLNHEVARFKDVDASVASYLNNVNTNPAYQELRKVRSWLRAAEQPVEAKDLIPSLTAYSERKQDYVDELLDMLVHNRRLL